MNDKLANFINQYKGQHVTAPGGVGGQCVDLVVLWMNELELPRIWQHAKDFQHHGTNERPFVPKRKGNQPNAGDVLIWSGAVGGGFGHNAIFVEGHREKFKSFDQNWPKGSPAALVNHNGRNLIGWLDFSNVVPQVSTESEQRRSVIFQEGDTVWKYSQEYGISVDTLLRINSIDDPRNIPVGFELYLDD